VSQPLWLPAVYQTGGPAHPMTRRRPTLAEVRERFEGVDAPVERRVVTFDRAPEVRAKDDSSTTRTFEGHAAVFDKRSEDLGFFQPIFEVIKRGAFKDAIKQSDVRFLIDHMGMPLARSVNGEGTLELTEDTRGLLAVADIDTRMSIVNDLVIALERKDVSQMSFAFRMGPGSEQTWTEEDDGTMIRTIHKIGELFDVSAVTFPAYPDTDAGLRSSIAAPSSAEQVPAADAEEREHQAELDETRAGDGNSDEPWRAASRRRRLKQREKALRMSPIRKETSRARA
jgi:uncharacterized protein